MLDRLNKWLEHRTGYRKVVSALLIEHIPGGARWRYVWGSCLAFVFSLQLITGLLLMTSYSPGDSTAWSSVYFIQYQMDFGWLIRGLHHFGSQTMVVLLALHMLQVVIAGAQLPPREINWWLGLCLLSTVLGLSLTGYLLPWDQKGYKATEVATNIARGLPFVGPYLQKFVVGGTEYGHNTLTRFYTLHVGILPPLVILLTILHLVVFRRHGVTVPRNADGEGWFWPEQAFRDLLVSLLIFGVMVSLVLWGDGHPVEGAPATAANAGFYERWAHAGQRGLGANLDAPADPSQAYPARPEWYFLFLFRLLKYFEEGSIVGTVIIPTGVFLLLALLPLLGYGAMRRFGHVFGVLVMVGLLTGVACLTCLAIGADQPNPTSRWVISRIGLVLMPAAAVVLLFLLCILALLSPGSSRRVVKFIGVLLLAGLLLGSGGLLYAAVHNRLPTVVTQFVDSRLDRESSAEQDDTRKAELFQEERHHAEKAAARAVVVAHDGVPEGGAIYLLQRDPLTQGPKMFLASCAGCHNHGNDVKDTKDRTATASDLDGFGSESWILGLLTNPGDDHYFGRTGRTTMKDWIEENFPNVNLPPKEMEKLDAGAKQQLAKDRADLKTIAAWLAKHPRNTSPDHDTDEFKKGLATFKERKCTGCHGYEIPNARKAPDLTGYGDEDWLRLMIMAPGHPKRYGEKNTMPAFRDLERPGGAVVRAELDDLRQQLLNQAKTSKKKKQVEKATQVGQLSEIDRELIIRWLLKDYRVVFGGTPVSAVRKEK